MKANEKSLPIGDAANFHEKFFQQIRSSLPKEKSLAGEVEQFLQLSRSATYKKINGSVPLTMDELLKLAKAFKISLDNLVFDQPSKVSFDFFPLVAPVKSANEYLQRLQGQLHQATFIPEMELIYATTEIPIFHYLHFPELTAFKLLMWSRSSFELKEYETDGFSVEQLAENEQLLSFSQLILQSYNKLPSTEYWTAPILENTLNHVVHFSNQKVFRSKQTPRLICEQLLQLLDHQVEMARQGKKFNFAQKPTESASSITLYHNEIAHLNNNIYLKSPSVRIFFTTLDNPNFLSTSEPKMCDYMENWFDKLRRRSQRMSLEGEMYRTRFFNTQRMKVQKLMDEL